MAGTNRALKDYIFENSVNNTRKCVFISHKSDDKEAAKQIANYLMINDIDVYLDIHDKGLQKATEEKDSKKIVEHIQKAIKYSTHILVLVSDRTKESWWVPYEVGYAKKSGNSIASLLLKGYTDGFPDYLKIERIIKSAYDFSIYAKEIKSRYYSLFESKVTDSSNLNNYIRSIY